MAITNYDLIFGNNAAIVGSEGSGNAIYNVVSGYPNTYFQRSESSRTFTASANLSMNADRSGEVMALAFHVTPGTNLSNSNFYCLTYHITSTNFVTYKLKYNNTSNLNNTGEIATWTSTQNTVPNNAAVDISVTDTLFELKVLGNTVISSNLPNNLTGEGLGFMYAGGWADRYMNYNNLIITLGRSSGRRRYHIV